MSAKASGTIFGRQLVQADLLLYIKAKARQYLHPMSMLHYLILCT